MKAFCEFNDYEIVGEYEDAGKSGKSVEGRVAFKSMMEDIKTGKDNVSFVLVFKHNSYLLYYLLKNFVNLAFYFLGEHFIK